MSPSGTKTGLLLFAIIAVLVIAGSLAAYVLTGDMGIEDRFSKAVGLPTGEETGPGFSFEGNPVLFLVVLGVLLSGCYYLYRRFLATPEE